MHNQEKHGCKSETREGASRTTAFNALLLRIIRPTISYIRTMWTTGKVKLSLTEAFKFNYLAPVRSPKRWIPVASTARFPVEATPAEFIFAAIRTSKIDTPLTPRGQLSGALLASSALVYTSSSNKVPSGATPVDRLWTLYEISRVKDFMRNSYTGCIAAAFSYLYMQRLGFYWEGHWEELMPRPAPGETAKSPDFIFFKPGKTAIVESKGSQADPASGGLIRDVKGGWITQVLPHIKHADLGIAIGTKLTPMEDATVCVAYGKRMHRTPRTSMPTLPRMAFQHLPFDRTSYIRESAGITRARQINFLRICDLVGLFPTDEILHKIASPRKIQLRNRVFLTASRRGMLLREHPQHLMIPPLGYVRFLFPEDFYLRLTEEFYGMNRQQPPTKVDDGTDGVADAPKERQFERANDVEDVGTDGVKDIPKERQFERANDADDEAAENAPIEPSFESGEDKGVGWVRSADGLMMQYSARPFED